MKKFLGIILIFFIAFTGSFLGNRAALEQSGKEKVVASAKPKTEINYATKETTDLKSAIKKAYASVVEIHAEATNVDLFSQRSTSTALGSGVIISEDGNIITNHHVIAGATRLTVKTSDGKEYEAKLIGTDPKTDIAVIKIEAKELPYAHLADSDQLEIGDDAIVIGNPLGEGISVSNGIISALNKEVTVGNETMYLLQTNAAVNQGNSGGGLFNIRGELVGIVNAKSSSSNFAVSVEGLGYAIPSNTVSKIASDLLTNGYVKNRPTLGIKLVTVTQANNAFTPGLYITEVIEGSAASTAGLQKYDQITAIDGVKVNTYAELSNELQKHNVGDKIELSLLRNDKEINITVTLQEAINYNTHKNK